MDKGVSKSADFLWSMKSSSQTQTPDPRPQGRSLPQEDWWAGLSTPATWPSFFLSGACRSPSLAPQGQGHGGLNCPVPPSLGPRPCPRPSPSTHRWILW